MRYLLLSHGEKLHINTKSNLYKYLSDIAFYYHKNTIHYSLQRYIVKGMVRMIDLNLEVREFSF